MKMLSVFLTILVVLVMVTPVLAGEIIEIPVGDEFGYFLTQSDINEHTHLAVLFVLKSDGTQNAHPIGQGDYAKDGYEVHWIGNWAVVGKNYGGLVAAWVGVQKAHRVFIPMVNAQN